MLIGNFFPTPYNARKFMKTYFILMAIAAIVTVGCQGTIQSDIQSDMSAPDKYMSVDGYPADDAPPITNMPPNVPYSFNDAPPLPDDPAMNFSPTP
jgi:hypothetical protein